MSNFQAEDEVTGLAVSSNYIVAQVNKKGLKINLKTEIISAFQFFLEPELHVFDRNTHQLLHRLEGHEYGGQAVWYGFVWFCMVWYGMVWRASGEILNCIIIMIIIV